MRIENAKIIAALPELNVELRSSSSLAELTSLAIGGTTDLLCVKKHESIPGLQALLAPLRSCLELLLALRQQAPNLSMEEGRFAQTIQLIASSPWVIFGMWLPGHLRTLDVVEGNT